MMDPICDNDTSPIYYNKYSGFHPGIMGRSNNSHKISTQGILNDSPTVGKQTGYVSQEGGTGVTRRGYPLGYAWYVMQCP